MIKKSGFIVSRAIIAEMSSDGSDMNVPVDAALLKNVVDANKDDDPLFVTIEALNEGTSANKRNYTKAVIENIAQQVNEKHVDGYRGHLTDAERATKTPEAQTIWLGAVTKMIDGKMRLFVKGYVLPYAKNLRHYLRTAQAASKKVAVSITGLGVMTKLADGTMDMSDFGLESIDWARPGAEGVPTSGRFVLASEMHNVNINDEEINMTLEDALKSAKVDDLKKYNPELVTEMVTEAVTDKETELAEAQTVVTEMTAIRETLGIEKDADVSKAVSEMIKVNMDQELDRQLTVKVKNTEARKVIREMTAPKMAVGVNVSEMVDEVLKTDEAKAIVREMAAVPKIQPQIDRTSATQRKYSTVK
jgi:hypothetical protein